MTPENVWDYPRPPRLEAVPQRLRIVFAGAAIADTIAGFRVLETSHPPVYYLPRPAFTCEIIASERQSFCEWKGIAHYVSLRSGGREAVDCAWTYLAPTPGFEMIRDYLAVYPAAMDACFVDDEQVRPQPGRFYGGWVTDNLTGPFKGAAGTMGW
jgi:uncharacterized protein (DUF427 family)